MHQSLFHILQSIFMLDGLERENIVGVLSYLYPQIKDPTNSISYLTFNILNCSSVTPTMGKQFNEKLQP